MSLIEGEGRVEILYGSSPLPISPDCEVYLSRPDFAGAHPVVVVVSGDRGVTPSVKALCRRLARFGYVALAPKVYRGGPPHSPIALASSRIDRDLLGLLSVSRDEWSHWCAPGRFAVLGLGAGAAPAARFAAGGEAALVISPSALEGLPGALDGLAAPLLVLVGGMPAAEVHSVRDAVGGGEWVVYRSAASGFIDDGSDDYDRPAAEDAFRRLIAFLDDWLARVKT